MRDAIVAIVIVLGLIAAGFVWGSAIGTAVMRKEAIEHNAAHWSIDPKTGERSFCWGVDD